MEKYILQILEKNSRVIVPEFGAFIVKQKSPLTIVFNEFLQYNDGMLVDAFAKGEGIGRDEAKEKIDDFVKNITNALDKSGKFSIEELGLLVKNSAGKISLDSTEQGDVKETPKSKASAPAAKAEEKKPDKPVEKKVPQKPKKDEVPASKKPIPLVPKNKQTEKSEEKTATKEKPAAPRSSTKREIVKPPAEKTESAAKKDAKPEEKKVVDTLPPVATKETPKTETARKSPEYASFEKRHDTSADREKKKGNKILLWVLIIILVNAGILAIFYFNGYLNGLFGSKEDTEELLVPIVEDEIYTEPEESTPSMDPMIEEEIIENEPVPVAPPVSTQKTSIAGRKYYIVAGVFSVENNADRLTEELRGKGFNSEKFGKIGSMHAVSYGVYSSKAEANKVLAEIKQNENPQAWLKVVD